MQRFNFKLAKVLSLRLQEEHAVQAELARVLRERAVIVDELNVARSAEANLYAYLHVDGRTAPEMAQVARYGSMHREHIFNLNLRLSQYDSGVELVRKRLVSATAKRKALEKLKDKQEAKWRDEVAAFEQAEIDEIASIRHARRIEVIT